MLTIKHLNGPQAGTEVSIDQSKDRIVFGRQLDCDVQFPPEETSVARHHFALVRKPSGAWTVELFGTPYVVIARLCLTGQGEALRAGHEHQNRLRGS